MAELLIPGSGGGGSGDSAVTTVAQSAHGFSVGNVVRFNGTIYVLAKADSASHAEAVGIVSTVGSVNSFVLTLSGRISTLSGLTAGSVYFLDPSTAGALTATEPSVSGEVSKPLLIADSTSSGFVVNMRGEIIGSGGGGFTVGSSYLTAHAPEVDTQANNSYVTYTWSLGWSNATQTFPTSAGSDIEIDGMDDTKINILTTGWYEVSLEGLTAAPDTNTDSGIINPGLTFASGAVPSWFIEDYFLPGFAAITVGCQHNIATGPLRLAAGEVIQAAIGVGLSTPANTWSAAGPDLTITRLA